MLFVIIAIDPNLHRLFFNDDYAYHVIILYLHFTSFLNFQFHLISSVMPLASFRYPVSLDLLLS